ncbi:MAG: IPT/TIG domain-containing protein [Ignavibacteriales bacterium]|nr:IPT/TIG domain-containing protein [Ignavibacteriales bacterium]
MKMKFYNSNLMKVLKSLAAIVLLTTFIIGCNEETTESLYKTQQPPLGAQPKITTLNPPSECLAGVDYVEITGENFSTVLDENLVYFGSARAKVLEASPTRLLVIAPNNPKDTLFIKVTTLHSDFFNDNPPQYKLRVAAGNVFVKKNRKIFALTFDKAGNAYASKTELGLGKGIVKIEPNGTETEFADKGAETFFTSLKIKGTDSLVGSWGRKKALFLVLKGIKPAAWITTGLGEIIDFDFDNKGYIWAGGSKANNNLYRIKTSDKTVTPFGFSGEVIALRVFQGAVYVANKRDDVIKIFKYPITNNALGAEELYYDFTQYSTTNSITGMTFAIDGTMYLTTDDLTKPIVMVSSDKIASVFFEVIVPDAIFAGPVIGLAYGIADDLYFIRNEITDPATPTTILQAQEVVRVITKKLSAPYYGRGDL